MLKIYILVTLELWLLGYGYCACPANPPTEGRILCPGAHENTTEVQCIEFAFDCCWEDTPGAVSCHLNTDTANSAVNNYYHIPNTAVSDPDKSVSTAATAEVCSALCDSTQFCAGTMYRSRDGSCLLKKRFTSIGEVGASDYDLYIQRHLEVRWGADNNGRLYADGVEMAYSTYYRATNVNELPASTKSVAFELTQSGGNWGLKLVYNTGWFTGDEGYWKCTSDSSLITEGWAEWGSYNDSSWPEAVESEYSQGTYPSAAKPIWAPLRTASAWCRHHLMEQAPDICQLSRALCGSKAKCVRDGAFSFKCQDTEVVVASSYSHWVDNKGLLFDQNDTTCVQGGSGGLKPHFRIHKVDVFRMECTVTVNGSNLTCSEQQGMYVYAGNIENMDTTIGNYRKCVLSTSVADANNAALYTACTYTCAGECTAIVFNLRQINYPSVEICEITF